MIPFLSIISLGLLAYFLVYLYRLQNAALKLFYWPGFAIKLLGGVSLGIIYQYYYVAGDTFGFFADAQKVANSIFSVPLNYFEFLFFGDASYLIAEGLINTQERSLFLVKILSLVTIISFDNYWIASLYFSAISFLGCWYLFTQINRHYQNTKIPSAISFLALPSLVFWGSGIVKESLAIGSLMFLSGIFLNLIKQKRLTWWEWLVGLIVLLNLWNLKYYWVVMFIPSTLSSLFVIRFIQPLLAKLAYLEMLTWIASFSLLVLLASGLHPNFYLNRVLDVIVENNNTYLQLDQGPHVQFSDLKSSWVSILLNTPLALFSGLYRPFLTEVSTLFQAVIGLENLLLLLLTLYNLFHLGKFWNSKERLLIFGLLVYILLLAVFLTLSTPNFGTLSRYRIGFLPFLYFLLLCLPVRKLPWVNKLTLP